METLTVHKIGSKVKINNTGDQLIFGNITAITVRTASDIQYEIAYWHNGHNVAWLYDFEFSVDGSRTRLIKIGFEVEPNKEVTMSQENFKKIMEEKWEK